MNKPDISAADMEFLRQLGEEMRNQDNACTGYPVFCVQQEQTVYGIDTSLIDDDKIVYMDDEYNVVPKERVRETEDGDFEEFDEDGKRVCEVNEVGFHTYWETVQTCFSRKGAEEHIRINGHNLKKPRIYVESAYRNNEMIRLQTILKDLPPPTPKVVPTPVTRVVRNAVVAIMPREGAFVGVCRRGKTDDWNLPGGKVEDNEDVYAAIRREVKEETGLEPLTVEWLYAEEVEGLPGEFWNVTTFLVTGGGVIAPGPNEGACELKTEADLCRGTFGANNQRRFETFYRMFGR